MPYQFCTGGKYCYSSTTVDATIISTNCLVKVQNSLYTTDGTRVYNTNYTNNSLITQNINDVGINTILTSNPQWRKSFETVNGPMNRYAIWYDNDCNEYPDLTSGVITTSFSFVNSGSTSRYYLGFGVWTGNFTVDLNGEQIVSGGTNTMFNQYWHVIPITLLSCDNLLNFNVTSTESSQDGFGFAIYDNSYSEIISASNDSELNILFSSIDYLSTNAVIGPYVRASCPAGYMISSTTLTATCVNVVYTGCTCNCCNKYRLTYLLDSVNPNGNFTYIDCSGTTKIISPDVYPFEVDFCACDIITPINIISNNGPYYNFITSDGKFRLQNLTYECDAVGCSPLPDGPPPEPEPEPTCSDCGFTTISVGYDHTIAISGGTLYGWGSNDNGQLGLGITGGIYDTPQIIDASTDWVYVNAGTQSTFAINNSGELYVCGSSTSLNGGGDQLGLGNTTTVIYNTLQSVANPSLSGWVKVWSKNTSTIALRNDGLLYGTGWNEFYQLGLTPNSEKSNFTLINSIGPWSDVSFGSYHTLGIKTNGTIYSWGTSLTNNNLINPLGIGISTTAQIPTQIIPGSYPNYPLGVNLRFTEISAGNYHSVALSEEGGVWGWGSNLYGQLDCDNCGALDLTRPAPLQGRISPDGSYVSGGGSQFNTGYTSVVAAADMTLAITSGRTVGSFIPTTINSINWDGNFTGTRILTWGVNYGNSNQTILQDDANRMSLELKNDWCNVWIGGQEDTNSLCFFAKDVNGTIYTWGNNIYGQLGIPTPTVCSTCNGNFIGPIGTCFNNCNEACTCVCVEYFITNYSTIPLSYRYIDCEGAVQVEEITAGGYGPNTVTTTFCACLDTVTILTGINPNLVTITTNQTLC